MGDRATINYSYIYRRLDVFLTIIDSTFNILKRKKIMEEIFNL